MQKEYFNNLITVALILSTILMPFSLLPNKAEAQYGTLGGVSGYVRGLAPAIARLPQCQKMASNGIKSLFNGIGEIFSGGETGGLPTDDFDDNTLMNAGYLQGIESGKDMMKVDKLDILDIRATSSTLKATLPAVANPLSEKELKELNKKAGELVKDSTESLENTICIQSIGRLIAKMLLQKLTLSTVNWINSGYDGSPSFVQNPEKFFKDIAKKEILQFGIEINGISPFSKDWMRNNALTLKNKFADNARYSLEEMIAQTTPECKGEDGVVTGCDEAFSKDFSVGGWDAWTAMTQVPANNPLGAKLLFDNEIQKRLAGTNQSTAQNTRDALQAASGFLGDQRCISAATGRIDHSITRSEDDDARGKGSALCSTWKYVTPGKMLADAATNVMGYPNNSFLNVQDLNDAVAAVSDAILNQFSTSIYEKGFANLDYQGIDGVLVFNNSNSDFRTQTEKDYIPSQLSSSWLQANPDFNIRTDLTQALIDEQRTYSDKLASQNKELMSTTDGKDYDPQICPSDWTGIYPDCFGPINFNFSIMGAQNIVNNVCPSGWTGTYPTSCKGPGKNDDGVSNAYGLMPAIYQLDYCIPGPHPGWEDDSRETLNNISIPGKEASSNETNQIVNSVIGAGITTAASLIPGVGSIVGPVLGSIFGAITGADQQKNLSRSIRRYYSDKFYDLTGYSFQSPWSEYQSIDSKHVNMMSSEGVSYVLNLVLDRYINIMNKTYFSSPDILPAITNEAKKEFEQLPGYNQIIKDNKNKILEIKTTVSILGEIKDKVDKLNAQLETNKKTEEQYEEALKFQINAFGRLSASMVNGDDIAAADDLAKQIVLKKDYLYKNLLKGPYGCEAFLENQANIKPFPSAGSEVKLADYDWNKFNVNSVQRMTYPFPTLYDYNEITAGATIPDPWNSGYDEDKLPKMPSSENKYNEYGPGFLSFVRFTSTFGSLSTQLYNGSERLQLGDLIYDHDPCGESGNTCDIINKTLGKSEWNGGRDTKVFETTIGVY